MFKNWFGSYLVKKLPLQIQENIKFLIPTNTFKLENDLLRFINKYKREQTNFKEDGYSLEIIEFAQVILEELQSDLMWKQYKKNRNINKINQLVNLLNSSDLTETHIHLGQTTASHIHWKYLVKFWKLSLIGKSKIIKRIDEYAKKEEIFLKDAKNIKKIINDFFAKKVNEVEAFLNFRKLLIMRKRSNFDTFCKKANVFNVIDEESDSLSKTGIHEPFVTDKFRSVLSYCKNQNINYAEIRLMGANLNANKIILNCLNKALSNSKIKLRIITFGGALPIDIESMYKKLPKKYKSYIVGVDLMRFTNSPKLVRYSKQITLPQCNHAGEFYAENEPGFEGLNPEQRIEQSLKQVLRSAQSKGIVRIGHANILGEDIDNYIGFKSKKLHALRKRTISAIKKNKVIIEANPTSNMLIANFPYKKHPIKVFLENRISFTISTDDRVTFNTNLKREFMNIALTFNLSLSQVEEIIETGKDARLDKTN